MDKPEIIKLISAASVAVALFALPVGVTATESVTGMARVVDGDTLVISGKTIRLSGIDAPESNQRCTNKDGKEWMCGQEATNNLKRKIGGSQITCDNDGTDRYGRMLGTCYKGHENLNGWMVKNGWAIAYRQYSTKYVVDEGSAKTMRRGIWNGSFTPPSEHRRGNTQQVSAKKEGCKIKGNINSKGEKIYHTPSSPWYSRTKIDKSKGQRWFCTEEEARAAGWRPAGR